MEAVIQRSVLGLMTIGGNLLIVISLFHCVSHGTLPVHFGLFLFIALLFALSSRLSILLPSGANWRPGLLILIASVFLLPLSTAPLVAIPGLIVLTPRFKWTWRHYPTTFAHVAIGLYLGSFVFQSALRSSFLMTYGWFVHAAAAVTVALAVHLVVNRTLSAVIVSNKRNIPLRRQLGLVARELHWGYYTSYLVLIFTGLLSLEHLWFAVCLNASIQLGLYKMMSYYQLLQESEERYRSLIQHHPDGICSLDQRGKCIHQNPAFRELLGYPEDALRQKYFVELIDPASKSTDHQNPLSGEINQEIELTLQDHYGHSIISRCTSVPMMVQGHRIGLYVIVKDIGPQKRAEAYIRQHEKLSTVGQLAAGVAHEIRNPLTALHGFVDLMKADISSAKRQAYLDIMKKELTHIEHIAGELLALGKPQAINMKYVDLRKTLLDVVDLLNTLALMRGVQIVTAFPDDLPLVRCDENQLKQVFINIAKNGIESMEQGILTIRLLADGTSLCVEIEDQGKGIPSESLAMVGSPFYTTKVDGTGLGLTISQRIIADYRGHLDVQSEPGRGTRMTVSIPITAPPS